MKKGGAPVSGSSGNKPAAEKKRSAAQGAVQDNEALSAPAKFIQFLKDVRVEFDKITWANRKETLTLTVATLSLTFFISAYLGLVDIVLSKIVSLLIN